jgi:ParB family chromosome partitioning protein
VASAPRPTDDVILGTEQRRQEVRELELREIMPNRLQPRTRPSAEGLDELAASIREHGVISPVLVRAIPLTSYEGAGCRYELVAGERRWRASRIAGRTSIPALLVEDAPDDRTMLELAITENLQREDLHPIDEALALGRMHQELGYSFAQIGERLGKSKGYVQNRMRLLSLDEDLQRLVAERPDTLGHVYEIGRLADGPDRAALIAAVRDDRISRAETRMRVEALLSPPPPAEEPAPYFQKYDGPAAASSDGDAGQRRGGGSQGSARRAGDGGLLSARERGALVTVAGKLARALGDPTLLTAEDWEAIEPMIRQLGELTRKAADAGCETSREG